MAVRLRTLWRGEIALPKTFWFLGVVPLLLFSFIFISSQTIFVSIAGKYSNAVIYFDYFLIAVYVSFGIFILVAVWRSADKYQGSKRWPRLSKLSSILLILYFGANLGFYVFIKTFIPSALEAKMDYTPEKMMLVPPSGAADELYLGEFKLNFPFYKEDIKSVSPFFHESRFFSMSLFLSNTSGEGTKGYIMFDCSTDTAAQEQSITTRLMYWLLNGDASPWEIMKKVHYSRWKDYSWLNLLSNIRLSSYLLLKAMTISAGEFSSVTAYETRSPYLEGILIDRRKEKDGQKYYIEFHYARHGKTCGMVATGHGEDMSKKIMDMISSIKPESDIERSYKETKTLYENKDKARYPEEVLLISLISVKGPTIDSMNDLLKIEEEKDNKNQFAIDGIKKEIAFLSRAQMRNN